MSQLEDNVQNVSSKALSSEVLCSQNREKIEIVQTKLEENREKIKLFQSKIEENQEKIKLFQTGINGNQEKIKTVQSELDENREKIELVEAKQDSERKIGLVGNQLKSSQTEEINLKSLNPVPVVQTENKETPKKSD